eukprot:COSAG02_NODE_165_length_32175_cov_86.109490_21_plen_256_part_00
MLGPVLSSGSSNVPILRVAVKLGRCWVLVQNYILLLPTKHVDAFIFVRIFGKVVQRPPNHVGQYRCVHRPRDVRATRPDAARGLAACVGPASSEMAAAVTVGKLLAAAKQTVSIAESSSGGAISARLLAVPGASSFFAGGVVCYSSQSKFKLLGLDRTASAPSATKQHAIELADAARTVLGTEWGIGETGVAGEQCAKNYLNIVTAFSRSIRSVRCIHLLAHCHATAAELPQVPQRTAEEFSQGSQLSPSRVPLV